MEQKVYIRLDATFHSALHAKNVEHVHAGKILPVYASRFSRDEAECIEATISFDESKVAGWLDLSPEHQYDFAREIALPELNNGSLQLDYYNNRINAQNIAVGRRIQYAMEKAIVASLDINSIIDDIKAQNARIDSQEAKDLIAKAQAEKASQRAKDDEERKAKDIADKAKQEAYAKEVAAKNAAKKAWIEANGSERLRLGFAKGHNCEKLYTLELCDSLPDDFALDYEGDVKTKERSCPSLEALKLSEELEKGHLPFVSSISIVWLPHALDDLIAEEDRYDEEPSTGIEAIELKVNGHYAYHLMA